MKKLEKVEKFSFFFGLENLKKKKDVSDTFNLKFQFLIKTWIYEQKYTKFWFHRAERIFSVAFRLQFFVFFFLFLIWKQIRERNCLLRA